MHVRPTVPFFAEQGSNSCFGDTMPPESCFLGG
jgi:hypothetical protein